MSIIDAMHGIEDKLTVTEGKDNVTISAKIDLEQAKKDGKDVHGFATYLVGKIYDKSTSTGFFDWLLGNEYNTHALKSEPGKFYAQTGQIKYSSFWDGI
ncbi:MAG: hypothetical protein NTY99_02575, partial [DPANN group archaeon]|nr:hypothetical protein [DPANN group archaeon]